MSAVSGVVSRQVLPACGSLCFFCPGLRARSRQPVKRYKKLIADIFPKNQVRLSSKGCLLLVFQVCCLLEDRQTDAYQCVFLWVWKRVKVMLHILVHC